MNTLTARCLFLAAALAAGLAPAADAPAANALRDLVGAGEYQAMGLDKLSAEQQARLLRWLSLREQGRAVPMTTPELSFQVDSVTVQATIGTAPVASPPPPAPAPVVTASKPMIAPPVPAAAAAAPAPVVAIGSADAFGLEQDRVDGEVTEIHARIVGAFTGWDGKTQFTLDNGQVWRQSTPGTYRYKATDPEVVIEKALIGYKLRLVETHRSVAVRRVK